MAWHLFEFMDHRWTPGPLRQTLLEVLDYCNSRFRPWYQQTAAEILKSTGQRPVAAVVELGAGGAPILREVARLMPAHPRSGDRPLVLIPTDLYPALQEWRRLQAEFPVIQPRETPVDFDDAPAWTGETLLVLAAALHHIPRSRRSRLLIRLAQSATTVLVFEPVRRTLLSILLTSFCWIPALLTPAALWNRPGRTRRILLCWLFPVVPGMFVWDGIVSCLREWSGDEWHRFSGEASLAGLDVNRTVSLHGEQVTIGRRTPTATPHGSK